MEESRISRSQARRQKKGKKRPVLIWIILAVVIIGAAGLAYTQFGVNSSKSVSESSKDTGNSESKSDSKSQDKNSVKPSEDRQPSAPSETGKVETKDNSGFTGLKGKVVDTETKKAIVDAVVETSDKSISVKTDIDGIFSLELPAGEAVAITVSAPSYFSAVAAGSVDEGQTKSIDFELRSQKGDMAPPSPMAF